MPPLVILVGPTAVGKTELSLIIAEEWDMEIVSADSMQVYRYMDIGTAKPSPEERRRVPHHLIDLVDPDQPFTVADYQEHFHLIENDLNNREVIPLLTGGTGLYIRAVTRGFIFPEPPANPELRAELKDLVEIEGKEKMHAWLSKVDPVSAARIHVNDIKRVIRALEVYLSTGTPFSQLQKAEPKEVSQNIIYLGLFREREELYKRIDQRVDRMIEAGLLDEVERLLNMGYGPELQSMQGLGYKEIVPVIQGNCSLEGAVTLLKKRTRHYAKRQLTWFRKEPIEEWFLLKKGVEEDTCQKILKYIEGRINQVSNSSL